MSDEADSKRAALAGAAARHHAAAARSGERLSLGSRAGFREHRAVHDRRGLRSRRSHRARRTARARRRARRPAVPGGVSRADGRRAAVVRFRERRRRHLRQAHRAPSARVRGRAHRHPPPIRIARGKSTRRASARREASRPSELADVPLALPALARAAKLGKRAGRVGFDWPDAHGRARQDRRRAAARSTRWPTATTRIAPRSSATCCSRWRTGRGISTSIPKRRCASPMPSSSGASAPWKSSRRNVRWFSNRSTPAAWDALWNEVKMKRPGKAGDSDVQ